MLDIGKKQSGWITGAFDGVAETMLKATEPDAPTGWFCPACKRTNAPKVLQCPCSPVQVPA